jgi:hypothetical protein
MLFQDSWDRPLFPSRAVNAGKDQIMQSSFQGVFVLLAHCRLRYITEFKPTVTSKVLTK